MEIHGLFSSDDDSREEQQRCASSWGWPEECRFRDPVQPSKQQLASGCTGFVLLCCRCVVTYVRGPDLKAGLHFSIRAQVGIYLGYFGWVQSGARVGRSGSASSRSPVPVFPS